MCTTHVGEAAASRAAGEPLPEPQARYDFALGHPLRGIYRLVARSNELSLVATAVLLPSTERGG